MNEQGNMDFLSESGKKVKKDDKTNDLIIVNKESKKEIKTTVNVGNNIKQKNSNINNNFKKYINKKFAEFELKLSDFDSKSKAYQEFTIIKNSISKLRTSGRVKEALLQLERLLGD